MDGRELGKGVQYKPQLAPVRHRYDLNARDAFTPYRFRDDCLRPLGHGALNLLCGGKIPVPALTVPRYLISVMVVRGNAALFHECIVLGCLVNC